MIFCIYCSVDKMDFWAMHWRIWSQPAVRSLQHAHQILALENFINFLFTFPQVNGAAAIQEIAQKIKNINDEKKKAEQETKRQAACVLRLKRSYYSPANRSGFGKVSPLCRKVLQKTVEEAKVCCCSWCAFCCKILFDILNCSSHVHCILSHWCCCNACACVSCCHRHGKKHSEQQLSW